MDFLIKVFVSILGFIGGNYINVCGVDISLVNKGSGLYDGENGFYVYKGENPNNYISFNDEVWRIMSIGDDYIKIIKKDSLDDMEFDEGGSNEWRKSTLYKFLNNDYYNSLDTRYKEIINGKIEIISMEDYLDANSNLKLCGSLDLYFKNDKKCFNSNYIKSLNSKNGAAWTLTKEGDTVFYAGNTYFNDIKSSESGFGVLPVLYLDKNIELYGKGTLQNPYKIMF